MSWEMMKLGYVLDYEQPTKYIVLSDLYNDNFTTPVLTAGKSFVLGYTNETEGVYTDLPVIIFDDFTTVSKYVDFKFKVKSSAMKILKAKEGIADTRFMFYLLQTLNLDCEQHKRYWISKFAPLKISLPPLATQKRIAKILDAADALKRKDQALLKKYDELAQTIFIDMFGDPAKNKKGWEVKKFDEVVEFPSGLVDPKILPYSQMFHVGGDNIESATGKIFGLKVTSDLALKSGKFHFTKKHILYNKIRPKLNKVACPDFEGICSADMYPLLPNEKYITKEYLYFILKSEAFLDFADKQSRRANIPKINMNEMSGFEFPIPPMDLQRTFMNQIKITDGILAVNIEASNKSSNLFQTLLQKSFNDELVA